MVAILALSISVLTLASVGTLIFLFNFRMGGLSKRLSGLEEVTNHNVSALKRDVADLKTTFSTIEGRMTKIETGIQGLSRDINAGFQKLSDRLPD